jgi:hypothetical protein
MHGKNFGFYENYFSKKINAETIRKNIFKNGDFYKKFGFKSIKNLSGNKPKNIFSRNKFF